MNVEERRAMWRRNTARYRDTPKGKKSVIKTAQTSYWRNRDKHLARARLRRAVRSGHITRPTVCSQNNDICNGRIEAHHDDYNRPYEVNWLCISHHANLHLKAKERIEN